MLWRATQCASTLERFKVRSCEPNETLNRCRRARSRAVCGGVLTTIPLRIPLGFERGLRRESGEETRSCSLLTHSVLECVGTLKSANRLA